MRSRFVLALTLLMGFAVGRAFGDSMAAPQSYTKTTPDEQYVFVMLRPPLEDEDVADALRSTCGQSGLYPNDGSTTALWTVDWYARNVEPLSDGVHLVRRGEWARSAHSEAVAFFAQGRLLKSYTVSDLVSFPSLMPHTASHFWWRSSERLLDAEKRYEIRTRHGERYLFDVTSGEIVRQLRPPRLILTAVGVVLVVGIVGFVCWRRRRRGGD